MAPSAVGCSERLCGRAGGEQPLRSGKQLGSGAWTQGPSGASQGTLGAAAWFGQPPQACVTLSRFPEFVTQEKTKPPPRPLRGRQGEISPRMGQLRRGRLKASLEVISVYHLYPAPWVSSATVGHAGGTWPDEVLVPTRRGLCHRLISHQCLVRTKARCCSWNSILNISGQRPQQ